MAPVATVVAAPPSLIFPSTPVGTPYNGTYLTSVVTNTGNVPVTSTTAAIGGANAGDFSFYSNGCGTGGGTLAPAASCTVYISFTPTAAGTRNATVTFSSANSNSLTIPLTGTGASPAATVIATPPALVFPGTPVGTPYNGTYLTSTVTNTGNVSVTSTTAAIGGANAGDFSFYSNGCGTGSGTLPPGSNCIVYISFTPTATGTRNATVTFSSANSNSLSITLTGTGVTPVSTLSVTPTVLPFPDTPKGTSFSGTYLTALATNTGNVTLNGVGGAISGTNASDFSFYSNGCGTGSGTLTPGASCTEYISFMPGGTGPRVATLTLTSSNASNSPVTVSLSGNGLAVAATAVVTPGSMNAGTETIGTTLTNFAYVTLFNTGNVPDTINSVNVTGDFSIGSNGCTSAVAVGSSCNVYVSFTPTLSGLRTGTLTIGDTSTTTPHTVALSGNGITTAQAIQLSQTAVTFGNQSTGFPSAPMLVYYSNQGNTTVNITAFGLGGANSGDYSLTGSSCGVTSIGSGSYCIVSITFTPTATGTRSATVNITDSAVGSPRTISITGTGVNPFPKVTLSPTNLVFATQNVGTTSANQVVTLMNSGTAALTFSAPTFAGTDFSLYSNGCTSPLAPGSTCYFYVQFAPSGTGSRTGTLTLTSNATPSTNAVSLTGTGVGTGPAVSLSSDSFTFASQTVGTTSSAQGATLTNIGNGPLTISSIGTSGDFAQTSTCPISPSTLAAGLSCPISVTFTPSGTGNRSGLVQITDNAAGNPQLINLAGVGTPAAPGVNLNPTSLVFSTEPEHVTSAPQNVTLTNSGAGTLTIGSIATSGDFAETNNCGSSLASLGSCTVSVTFTPTAAGTRTGSLIFTDNGPASPQTVSLSGTGVAAPLVTLSSQNLTYGSINVGSSSPTQGVTLTNSGTASLSITSIGVTSDPTNFSQTNTCPSTLIIGATCTITVTFSPTSEGGVGGQITIADNAYNTPQTIGLSGTGVSAVAQASPSSLTFVNQTVGSTSPAQTVTLYSEGNAPLTGISITITGDFAKTTACTTSLAAGANCTISVTFTPTATGTRTGTLSISDNAPGSPQTVSLSGTGTGAVLSLSPASLTFSSQTVGSTSAAQNITVTNTGNAALAFSSLVMTDSEFNYTNNCPASIAPSTPCTIAITFTPNAVGARSGSLILTDNAPGSPQTYSFSGTGAGAPAVTLNPASLTFASQAVGTTSTSQNVTLTNSGTALLNISTVTISGDFADSNSCSGIALAAGGSCSITVSFTPTAVGTRTGTITINDNASNTPQSVGLTGTGTGVAGIQFNPTSLTFASQAVGTSSTVQSFTIKNNGTASLLISSIAPTTSDFTETNTCPISPTSLAVGATCTVSVTFTPVTTGTRPGAITVTDNAAGSPQSVALTGTGTAAPQTITFAALPNVTYGVAPITLTASASSGLPVSYAVTGPASVSGSTLTITGAGSVTVTASQAGNSNYAAATPVSRTFTVSPAVLTVTANNLSRPFGAANPTLTYAITGFVNSDTSAVVSGAPSLSTTATTSSPAGTYPITITAGTLSATNYSFTFVNGTLTVTGGVAQTITFAALPNVTYGVAPITLTASASSGLPVSYAVTGPASVSGSTLTITGAGSVTVTASQAGNSNYAAATPVSRTFTVSPAVLTVTANNLSRPFGAANPTLTYAITGFVNSDTSAVVSGAPSLSTTATTSSPAGTYPITITAGTLSAANYSFTFVNGTLTVTGGVAQTITFAALPNVTYGVAPITLTASASSGLPVSYAVTGPASVSGSTLTITGAGSVTVTASQAGNSNYAAATPVSRTFTVSPAVLTVTANNLSRPFGAANPTLTYAITGFVNSDTSAVVSGAPSLSTTATTSSPAGTYPITITAGTLSAANYSFTFVNGMLTVTPSPTVQIVPAASNPVTIITDGSGNYIVSFTVTNQGNVTVNSLLVSNAKLGAAAFTGSINTLTNLAPGASGTFVITFPESAGSPGTNVAFSAAGTYAAGTLNGNWSSSSRAIFTLP